MKKLLLTLFATGLFAFFAGAASAQTDSTAKSVMHVVTVSWKADTTPQQIQSALDGARKLPSAYKGITRVWATTIKAQGSRTHAIAMEFSSEQALKDYTGSDAQKEWYKSYLPIREQSTTFDITN